MAKKPAYEQLEQRVKELEKEYFEITKTVADLRKSEEDYRSMIEYTNDLIEVTTFSLYPTYTYISPSHKEIMGYEPKDVIGKSVFEMIHPDDKKKLLPLLKKYLKEKAKMAFSKKDLDFTERIEYRAKDKSGDWHYLQSTGNLIGNKMLFISRDITEKKEIEEKLKNSEEVYRTITENAPIGIYYSDFSGNFIYGNRKAEEIIGYKSEELIGKNFLKLKLLQFKNITKAAKLLALNKLGKATGPDEFTLNKKDGSKGIVEINTELITIGGEKAVLGMVEDITERKRAKETLEQSEERYRGLVENSFDGIFVQKGSKIIFTNQRLNEMLGYDEGALVGLDHWLVYHPDYQGITRKRAQARMRGEKLAPQYEVKLQRKDGSWFYGEINAKAIALEGKHGIQVWVRDITEHKRSEEELKTRRLYLESVLYSTPDAIVTLDSSHRVLEWNIGARQIFGYAHHEAVGKNIDDLVTGPDVLDEAKELTLQVLSGGKVLPRETVRYRKDGIPVNVIVAGSPIIIRDKLQGLVAVYTDITEHKKVEEELRIEKAYLEQLFENAAEAIVMCDNNGRILRINSEFTRLFGYRPKEAIGQFLDDLIAPESLYNEAKSYTENLRAGQKIAFESRRRRNDGTLIDVLAIGSPIIIDNKMTGNYSIYRDITEGKKAEEALKESEEKYRTILESIEEGYYEVDIAGNFTFVNDSLCKIVAYSRDELIGMNYQRCTDEKSAEKMYQAFNRVYKTGIPSKTLDWEIIKNDAKKGFVDISASLIIDSDGNPAGFRGIVRDITEKKLLESQLLQAQKMEAVGTLAGGIAHNFNNLLMGIQGNASLMLLDTSPDHPHYERLTNIEKSVQSGSKLTSQLLGYARGGSYEVKPIRINSIIQETSATFAVTRKDIALHHDLEHTLSGVKADSGQIEQVILNIYVNAADAMVGGGDLFVTTRNISGTDIKKEAYTVKPGRYILITIRDTGTGMDKATQAKIFDPFFTTKGLARGTGLGLASAYGIIKAHGGYIDVESQKGKGTTFFLYLPASKETIGEEVQPAGTIEKGKETILLVDDEEIILDVGEALLTSLGYTVLIAHGGKETIEIVRTTLESSPPDLVILDMIMPHMGGGETYDRIKELHSNIKVLLSSGYSIDGQASEILKRGCDGFIQKPFTMKELSNAIREVLGKG